MLKIFRENFRQLPDSNKSMVYLMWIYKTGAIISSVFVNIYVFTVYQEILYVLYYNLIFVTSILLGFSGVGFFMSKFQKDIKNMYYLSYIVFILGFILLFLFAGKLWGVWLFALLNGFGAGAFWCAVHGQEMVHIRDEKRDLYSSFISAGNNIVSMLVPLLVAFLFFLAGNFPFLDGYMILFLLLPFFYGLSFLFIRKIESYVPSKILKKDIKNFFNLKKYTFGLLYIFGVSLYQGIGFFLTSIIAIHLLKTELNVGLFEGIISIFSTFLVMFLGSKRAAKNRLKIMGYLTIFLTLNYFLFAYNFTLFGYILFTFIGIILLPLYRVSEHVYDLKIMDTIKAEGSDFYPAMILREIVLWLGRVCVIGCMIWIYTYGKFSDEQFLRFGLVIMPFFFAFTWLSMYLHIRYEEKK